MPSNSQIRSIQFAQGVIVTGAADTLSGSDIIDLLNNQSALSTGLTYDITTVREAVFDYSIVRYTDSTGVTPRIERGRMRLTANPKAIIDADKWILSWDNKNDEGTTPGVTFTITVASGVVTLKYATTNIAGANHHCYFSYELTIFPV